MINELKPYQRHLKLSGCMNFRELGGYKTIDGKQTKWQTLFRSDSLHQLPESSQKQLINYGIKTIVDLRSSFELESESYPLSQRTEIQYFNFPLIAENQRNIIAAIKHQSLLELNTFFLEERSQIIKTIIETIATQTAPVVIHCAVGKDRTGVISALLLAIAGVTRETIAQDYNLSDIYLAPLYEELRPQAERENFTHLLSSPMQTMLDTFEHLEENYGGVKDYLKQIGVDDSMCVRLRAILIDG